MLVAYQATKEELNRLELLQKAYMRNSRSDLLRFLVNDAYKKIFENKLPTDNNQLVILPTK